MLVSWLAGVVREACSTVEGLDLRTRVLVCCDSRIIRIGCCWVFQCSTVHCSYRARSAQ